MYWLKPVRGAIDVRCPELGGVRSRWFKCTVCIGKSIGGMSSVRCIEVVRFSEGPLLEVLLYTEKHVTNMTLCDATSQHYVTPAYRKPI